MSKDKKDKLKKYDLFSIMMDQSAVFRDMVAQFQKNFGFQASISSFVPEDVEPATTPSANEPIGVKAKGAKKKTKASAKAATKTSKSAAAKKVTAKKASSKKAKPAQAAGKPAKKRSPKKASASK